MYQIGILQLTQHLDDALQGFKAGLTSKNIEAEFHYCNADGNIHELPKLAAKLAEKKVDLIFACSTPSALQAVKLEGSIPVVFTPVFDPVGAGLVKTMEAPGGKATGVSGMVKAQDKLSFLQELLPEAKNIGILYHSMDTNALVEVKNLMEHHENPLYLIPIPVQNPEELSNLPDLLAENVDALFLPIGKIIEENFASIIYYTDSISLPVIASHAPNVSAGAIGALVANHYQLGVDCAEKASQILSGTAPSSIPVDVVKQPEVLLNEFAAQNLDIEFSEELRKKAKEIFE